MNSTEYKINVKRSESPNFKMVNERLLHGAIGVCTEAGELMDIVKKSLFYNRQIDLWSVQEEIGDLFWYLGLICDEFNWSFEEIMDKNIKKLRKRYPEQFSEKDEQNRDYQEEQDAAHKTDDGDVDWSKKKGWEE